MYGLALRSMGTARVAAGLHYVVVNIAASVLFLIGVALIYGVVGTLNMADLARRFGSLDANARTLFDAGAASMLGVAMFYFGHATLVTGTIGMLAAHQLARLVAYSVAVSTGMLLAALGLGIEELTAPALFYLIVSVLTTSAFFMLTGMTDRTRSQRGSVADEVAPAALPFYSAFGVREPDPYGTDDDVGVTIPRAIAFLGSIFVCCVLLVAGLPPLPGFVAKFSLLSTAITFAPDVGRTGPAWALAIAALVSGFAAVVALTRVGMRLFWTATARATPRLRVVEAAPVAAVVALCVLLGIGASPVMGYLESAAQSLHEPQSYIREVVGVFTTDAAETP